MRDDLIRSAEYIYVYHLNRYQWLEIILYIIFADLQGF
jgi:hypothetical protein